MVKIEKKTNNIFSRFSFYKARDTEPVSIAYHEALIRTYADAYLVINTETNEIIDYNDKLISMFLLPPEVDPKALRITQIMMRYLAEDSANKDLMMNRIPDHWQGEAGFFNHDKEKFFVVVSSDVFTKDEVKYQIVSLRDITDKKKAEEELRSYKENAEKAARAKARFLSSMSHELRTPLNGIIGTSNLILLEPNLPEIITKHVNVLRFSSEHMLGIINDILDFSKIEAGKMELKRQNFSVKECLCNIIETFDVQFKNKDIRFVFKADEQIEGINIISDEVKLSQILNNLLGNALKFTHDGSVTLAVKLLSRDENTSTISFSVTDTGIGIPEEKQAEIFQGFAQVHADELSRRFGGTGLGLTISEKLVAKFGGKLQVESRLGEGSRFYFDIVFENAKVKEVRPKVEVAAGFENISDTRGLRVLVVEDNEINASILISFLHKWGIQVKEAENGIHALELIKFHKFDLVLMDLEMPEMDGYEAIKIMRKTDKKTPVLAFTATLLENMDSLVSETGFNDYVLKPYRPGDLKKKILQYAPHRKIEYA